MTTDLCSRLTTQLGEILLDVSPEVYGHRLNGEPAELVDTALGVDAESMADALLPFVHAEIARELRRKVCNFRATAHVQGLLRGEVWIAAANDCAVTADELDPEGSTR